MKIFIPLLSILALASAKFLDQSVIVEKSWENVIFGGFRPPPQFGMSQPNEAKIVGGLVSKPGAYPYQISLQVVQGGIAYHTCGGSIISANKIACAAHCCVGQNLSKLRVVAGAHNMKVEESTQQVMTVSRIVVHPGFISKTMINDGCKLFLTNRLNLNARVATIPPCQVEPTSGTCVATGWGLTSSESSNLPTALREVNLAIISRSKCTSDYSSVNPIKNSMLCAGGTEDKGGCNGDSGGPLVCTVGGTNCLAGATSWGMQPCGQEKFPTVFTNIAGLYGFYNSD